MMGRYVVATELGAAYLSILPDLSKLGGLVSKGMTSAGKSGAKAFGAGVDSSLGSVAKSFADAGKDAGEALAKAALSAAKSDIAKLSKTVATATDAQAAALGRLRVAQAKLAEVQGNSKAKASQLAAAEEAVANAQRKATVATNTAKTASDSLTKAQSRAKTAAEDVAKAQSKAATAAATSGTQTGNRFTRAFKSAFTPATATGDALKKVDGTREGNGLGKRFGTGFNKSLVAAVAVSSSLFAGLGVSKVVTDSIGLEATFSQTMNTMAAVAKVPADGIKDLSALAIQMGADTTFSAAEASGAMLELAKGGLSAATISGGALQGTLTLAAAGGTDLATASTIASNALNTFGLKGSDMASVAAALAGGANASSASVESLGEALSQVGPGASTAGLSLQDTVGVLSSFDAAGIKGSDAGTSLKTMLTRLVPTTNAARDSMRDLGLKFTDANGKFLPITDVAEQLRTKLSGLSDAQRTTALSTIFGSDATRAATVLMKQGSAGLAKYITATKDQGAAEEVAAARMSGTAGAWESFKGSVETAKLQLGLFLAPTIQAGLKKITEGVNAIVPSVKALAGILKTGNFSAAFREAFNVEEDSGLVRFILAARSAVISFANFLTGTAIPVIGTFLGFLRDNKGLVVGLAAAIGALVVVTKLHAAAIALQAAGGFLPWLGKVVTSTKLWSAATKGLAAVQWLLNTALFANPIGLVILGIVALVAAILLLWRKNEGFRKALTSAWDAIKGAAVAVFGAVKTAVTTAVDFVRDHWKLIVGILGGPLVAAVLLVTTHWDKIKAAFGAAVSAVVGALRTTWGAIVGVVSGPLNAILGFVKAVWSRVSPLLQLPVFIALRTIQATFGLLRAAFTFVKDWVVGAFKKAWSAVSGVLSGPINTAKTWIGQRFADIKLGFTVIKDWVIGAFKRAWAAVRDTLVGPVTTAKTWIGQRIADIRTGFTAVKDWVLGAFAKAWDGLKAKMTGPVDAAKSAIGTALGAAKGGIQWVFSQAVSAIGSIWDGLQELAKKPIRFIVNTVLNDGLISAFNWIAGKFQAPTIARIPLPAGFAEGGQFSGRLPGRPSSRDNMLGMTAAGPVGLATGEFIVNARDTARNLPLLQQINSGLGFADGGLFGKVKGFATSAFNAGKSFGGDVLEMLKNPVKWFKDKLAGPLNRMSELGSSPFAEIVKSVPRNLVNTVAGKAKDLLGIGGEGGGPINAGLAGVLQWVRTQVGKPYLWGGVGPVGYDCSGLVSAAINVAMGRNPFQRLGATGSMPWSMFAPGPGAFSVGWFKGNPGHTAATVNGVNIESRGGRGVVMGANARGASNGLFTNRMHVKGFASGGLVGDGPYDELDPRGKAYKASAIIPRAALSFDDGGLLPTGYSVVHNGTGSPEPVGHDFLRKEDLDGLAIRLDIPSVGVLTGHIDARARKVQAATASAYAHDYGMVRG